MMRARKWFNGEDEEIIESTDKWYDGIIDKTKATVSNDETV